MIASKIKYLFIVIVFSWSCATRDGKVRIETELLNTQSNASLRGLCVVDEKVIWASGSSGSVLLSTDGGSAWESVSVPGAEANDFRSLHAWDAKQAIVFGVSGPRFGYRTADGGKTWQTVYSDTIQGLFFNSLKFADKFRGLAVSDPVDGKFFVIRTEDGGFTWSKADSLPAVEEGEANFAASNTCIEYLPSGKAWIASGGNAARVFYTVDNGKNWNVSNTPMIRGSASAGIFSIAFVNDSEGVVVGGIYDQPEVNTNIAAYSQDGGISWQPAEKMPAQYRSCVQKVETENGSLLLAMGKTGCDITADTGKNWNFLSNEGYYTFRMIRGAGHGFAAGADGRIVRFRFLQP